MDPCTPYSASKALRALLFLVCCKLFRMLLWKRFAEGPVDTEIDSEMGLLVQHACPSGVAPRLDRVTVFDRSSPSPWLVLYSSVTLFSHPFFNTPSLPRSFFLHELTSLSCAVPLARKHGRNSHVRLGADPNATTRCSVCCRGQGRGGAQAGTKKCRGARVV